MGLFDDPKSFADKMIEKFGVVEYWYLRYKDILSLSNDPTKPNLTETKEIPIKLAISSWEIDLINEQTILSGDRKCYIAYIEELEGLIKADNYIVKKDGDIDVMKYKIVTPTQPLVFKDIIAAYMVNIRA